MSSVLHQIFKIGELNPTSPAVIVGESVFTYAALCGAALEFAETLKTRSVSAGDRVILVMPNSFEYVVALIGIWSVGGIAVPMANESRSSDVERHYGFAKAKLIVHQGQNALNELSEHLALAEFNKDISTNSVKQQDTSICFSDEMCCTDESTALIIFTSGTTGDPKGIELSHRNLKSNCDSVIQYLELNAKDRIYHVLPFHYSYGNSVLLTHLLVGASVYIGKPIAFIGKVIQDLNCLPCTGFSGVPSTFAFLVKQGNFCQSEGSHLRYITQAGGKMTVDLTKCVLDAFPKCKLFVMYGQTEATARLTYLPAEKIWEKMGSAGIPIPGMEIKIVDPSGSGVKAGTEGEVVARGDSIMKGYWKNPRASDETIRDGWLHTGDLGYIDSEGYLFLKGRKSQMIKSGGHRINPLEIEEIVAELDDIDEVAVAGTEDDLLGEAITIFYVSSKEEKMSKRQILKCCKDRLPIFKQPKNVIKVSKFPKTASGKIQKHLLAL